MKDTNEYILGLDIGGTKTACVIGTRGGEVLTRGTITTQADQPVDKALSDIVDFTYQYLDRYTVTAVSVSIGGPIDLEKGQLRSPPHLPRWAGLNLREELESRYFCPVYIEHDGNAGALAEWLFGHGKGLRNMVFITHGTGFGAGLIIEGELYRGSSSLAGEIGHVRIAGSGPRAFGKAGSVESFCSGLGISLLATHRFPARYPELTPAKMIIDDYHNGIHEAVHVIKESAFYTGRALSVLVDILNPQLIVLGVLSCRIGERYMKWVNTGMKKESLPAAYDACELKSTSFGESIGDVASLMAAIANR